MPDSWTAAGGQSPAACLPSPPAVAASLAHGGESVLKPHVAAQLTRRQREVLEWVCEGKSNGEVAGILKLSCDTVKKHLQRIYLRLGVENRFAAIVYARRDFGG